MPLNSSLHVTNEMRGTQTSGEGSQNAIQAMNDCRCTADSLALVPELQQYATCRIKLSMEAALRLTRRGNAVVSRYFDCPHHSGPDSTQTPLLACILMLMQVSVCFTTLRISVENPESERCQPVTVGDMTIKDDETRLQVVNVVLDAEIRKVVELSTRLKDFGLQQRAGSNTLHFEPMLLLVRQELDNALGNRRNPNN